MQLTVLFENYPENKKKLDGFKENVLKFRERTFEKEWADSVRPMLEKITNKESVRKNKLN